MQEEEKPPPSKTTANNKLDFSVLQGSDTTMQILKAKIRRHGATTSWFDLAPRLTVVNFQDRALGRLFLTTLETINPIHSLPIADPFQNEPCEETVNGHIRRIYPHKRTVAMLIFSSPPQLVGELAELSPLLYETDRIEVGRRLDYSRWLNFVELASSSRWSEAIPDLEELANSSTYPLNDSLRILLKKTSPVERIVGTLAETFLEAIDSLPSSGAMVETLDRLRETGLRAAHFHKARLCVKRRLPHSLHLGTMQERMRLLKAIHTSYRNEEKTGPDFLKSINAALAHQTGSTPLQLKASLKDFSLHGQQGLICSMNDAVDTEHTSNPNDILLDAQLASAFAQALGRFRPLLLLDGFSLTATDIEQLVSRDNTGCQWLCATGNDITAALSSGCHSYTSREIFR